MRFAQGSGLAVAASIILSHNLAAAQTSTKCNPLTSQCPADPALSRTVTTDFTSGESDDYTASGNSITYGSDGAQMSISKKGDSPLLVSNWFLMFGRFEIEMKAAPGTGIVTSAVLQSMDLDEIDWEMLGSDPSQIQTNYFGKGQTGSYDRGTFVPDSTSQSQFNTYTIDWTATQIVWQINGKTVRTLEPSQAPGQYPQTPMQIKVGPWAGGDPSNEPGVQQWAGGQTTYDQTYSMYVKSIKAQDYSTGKEYQYSGTDGTWQQVKSNGGKVNPGGTAVDTSAPATTSTTSGQPVPFSGTHAEPKSSQPNLSVYPWVAGSSMTTSTVSAATSIPGLPAGWTVSDTGKVVPPSSAAVSMHPHFLLCSFALALSLSLTSSPSLVDIPSRLLYTAVSVICFSCFASAWR